MEGGNGRGNVNLKVFTLSVYIVLGFMMDVLCIFSDLNDNLEIMGDL